MQRLMLVLMWVGVLAVVAGCASSRANRPSDDQNAVVMIDPPQDNVVDDKLAAAEAAKTAGDYETAMAMFREILAVNPTVTSAYVGIGDIAIETEDYQLAESNFSRAAYLEPRSFDAQFGHGLALQLLNRLADAIKAYHKALTIQPDNPRANLNMATTYLQLGEPTNALAFAEKAVANDPANGAARVNLGAVYERLSRYTDAIEQYDAALELMEPTPPLLMNMLNALAREGRFEEAKNTAEALVKLEPSANAYERLGWAQFRLKNYAASIDAYRLGAAVDPDHWPSLNGVGVNAINTWLVGGKRDEAAAAEARDSFRRSLRLNADQPRIIKLLTDYGL